MALDAQLVSQVVGWQVKPGDFSNVTRNLPQSIVMIGEANNANQSDFDENEIRSFLTAKEVADRYGFGSPLHMMARMLRPSGGGVGSIPTVAIPQKEADAAAAKQIDVTPTFSSGTAPTSNVTHFLEINDRLGIDGENYSFTITTDDDIAQICGKIEDAINNVTSAPVTATSDGTTTSGGTATKVTLETKWLGITAQETTVSVFVDEKPINISYATSEAQAGAGTQAVTNAVNQFGEEWRTIIVNSYADTGTVLNDLENVNGKPDADSPTGRYKEQVFKPFVALTGTTSSDISSSPFLGIDTSGRKTEVTNVIIPAPDTNYYTMEIAATAARSLSVQAQNEPHRDLSGRPMLRIDPPDSIGDFADYTKRDALVKDGKSTVVSRNGQFEFNDIVTTYRPDGEIPPQFRYVRNLIIDWNIRYQYYLLEQTYVVGKTIAADGDTVSVSGVVKPKDWQARVAGLADTLGERGLIADPDFMKESITVEISSTNPDRFETRFRYKRTGLGRISDTVVEAGFNLG